MPSSSAGPGAADRPASAPRCASASTARAGSASGPPAATTWSPSTCLVAHPRARRAPRGAPLPRRRRRSRCAAAAATGERLGRSSSPSAPRGGRSLPADVRRRAEGARSTRRSPARGSASRPARSSRPAPTAPRRSWPRWREADRCRRRTASLVDAYAGVGLFARHGRSTRTEVVAVESSRRRLRDARANLAGRPATVVDVDVEPVAAGAGRRRGRRPGPGRARPPGRGGPGRDGRRPARAGQLRSRPRWPATPACWPARLRATCGRRWSTCSPTPPTSRS